MVKISWAAMCSKRYFRIILPFYFDSNVIDVSSMVANDNQLSLGAKHWKTRYLVALGQPSFARSAYVIMMHTLDRYPGTSAAIMLTQLRM